MTLASARGPCSEISFREFLQSLLRIFPQGAPRNALYLIDHQQFLLYRFCGSEDRDALYLIDHLP